MRYRRYKHQNNAHLVINTPTRLSVKESSIFLKKETWKDQKQKTNKSKVFRSKLGLFLALKRAAKWHVVEKNGIQRDAFRAST